MSGVAEGIRYDRDGLVAVVAQGAADGRVLMVAWADAEAVERTLATGFAHYHSRSRGRLWKKGEESGNVQRVREVRVDCDGDTLLYLVEPAGPACHTGEASCFFRTLDPGGAPAPAGALAPGGVPGAGTLLDDLYQVILARRARGGERSYVRRLLDAGPAAVAAKVTEEAAEVGEALCAPEDDDALVHEVADLWFHSLVALGGRDLPPTRVLDELRRRFGISGVDEKEGRTPAREGEEGPP